MYDRYGRRIDDPISPRTGAGAVIETPLTSPEALHALTYLTGDPVLVDRVVNRYPSWEALSRASSVELGYNLGVWAAQLRIPPHVPAMPEVGAGIIVKTRYEQGYPRRLLDLPNPPALLYHLGELPERPLLGIGGTHFPSAKALSFVKDVVKAAVKAKIMIVAAFDTGCGHAALEEAVDRRGRVLAVASGDLAAPSSNSVLLRRVLDNGGAVVSEWGPDEPWSEASTFEAARLVAALSHAVTLPEFGMHPTGGSHLARAAVGLERRLVVPAPPADAELPVNADGVAALVRKRSFSERLYGSNPRIEARMRLGHPPADHVVSSTPAITAALQDLFT